MARTIMGHNKLLTDRLERSIAEVRTKPSETRVHALRVRIKKLRSLLRLAAHVAPAMEMPAGTVARLRRLFRVAGAGRDMQVGSTLLAGLDGVDKAACKAFTDRNKERQERAEHRLTKALKAMRKDDPGRLLRYVDKAFASAGTEGLEKAMAGYVTREMEQVSRLMAKGPPAAVLHEVRKHVKNAWHTQRMPGAPDIGEGRMRAMAEAQERLGRWHDGYVLVEHLAGWRDGGPHRDALLPAARNLMKARQQLAMRAVRAMMRGRARPNAAERRATPRRTR